MKAIDGHALAEDFKVDRMNLFMDGLKGTPREYCISLNNVIERIEDAPVLSIEDISKELLKIDKIVLNKTDADLLEQYKKLGHILVNPNNTVTIIDTPKTEYIDKKVSKIFQNMSYRQGVRNLQERLVEEVESYYNKNSSISKIEMLTLINRIADECARSRGEVSEDESI